MKVDKLRKLNDRLADLAFQDAVADSIGFMHEDEYEKFKNNMLQRLKTSNIKTGVVAKYVSVCKREDLDFLKDIFEDLQR